MAEKINYQLLLEVVVDLVDEAEIAQPVVDTLDQYNNGRIVGHMASYFNELPKYKQEAAKLAFYVIRAHKLKGAAQDFRQKAEDAANDCVADEKRIKKMCKKRKIVEEEDDDE